MTSGDPTANAANATAPARRTTPGLRPGLAVVALLGCLAPPAAARVLLTQAQALELAFPGCEVQRQTLYLTAGQVARAGELAGEPLRSALVHAYAARCGGRPAGTAYFDTHPVRTLPETVMVVVDEQGRSARVEVLSFQEPPDYLPREGWYAQFRGRPLDDELRLRRAVRPVTGATLTACATTDAVRRVLAIDRVAREARAAQPQPAPAGARKPPSPGGTAGGSKPR